MIRQYEGASQIWGWSQTSGLLIPVYTLQRYSLKLDPHFGMHPVSDMNSNCLTLVNSAWYTPSEIEAPREIPIR